MRSVAYQMRQIIEHFFPDLFTWMREIEDCRSKSEYELAEIITACLAMFLFKVGSRNGMNNLQTDPEFRKNYKKLFQLDLPHPDTIKNVMRVLHETHLEELKRRMIQALLNKKALHKFRFCGQWFLIAVDATGVVSFKHQHCEQCQHSTSKKGKVTWFHTVLEAKLVTSNGFALSLGTEWIENPVDDYDKQDCERKAFIRLAARLKKDYPRLPICIVADGLYPYQGFFNICKGHDWRYIDTFKDGCLPSVWEEVESLLSLQTENLRSETRIEGQKKIERSYRWVTGIDYNGHRVNWLECRETISEAGKEDIHHRFVHLTDLKPDYQGAPNLSAAGRRRWKIENEGFNAQKNQGYGLTHKFARKSYRAMKNYYQCLQIAHIINELLVLSVTFQNLLTGKMTLKHIWKCLQSLMGYGTINAAELQAITAMPCQIRFAAT